MSSRLNSRPKLALCLETLAVAVFSFLVMCLVRPEFFLGASIRFTSGHDIEIPYEAAFMHARYFIGGALDLWNRFDQFNGSYFQLGTTLHSPVAIFEGALFALLRPFFSRPGEAFQQFHAIAYFGLACLVRTAGGVALFSFYGLSRFVRVVSLLLLNTLVAGQTYVGNMTGFTYSLAPLVMFYIVLLFRERRLAYIGWLIAAFATAFATTPLFAVGYFYLPFHFMLLASIVSLIVDWRRGLNAERPRPRSPALTSKIRAFGAVASVVWVVVTNLFLFRLMRKTFFLSHTAAVGTKDRFDGILNPLAFFSGPSQGPAPRKLLSEAMNFDVNSWAGGWMFVGTASIGLAIIGLVCSRRRDKWVYAAVFGLIALAQIPARTVSFGMVANVLTAFTNPFAFLIVHPHMSTLMIYYFLLPLSAFGLETLVDLFGESPPRSESLKAAAAAVLLIALGAYGLSVLPFGPGVAAAALSGALILSLLCSRAQAGWIYINRRTIVGGLALLAIASDLVCDKHYLANTPYTGDLIQPRVFKGLEQFGPVVIDYQNPAIMPVPRRIYVGPADDIAGPEAPSTDKAFPTPFAVYFNRQDDIGAFYHSVFASRDFPARRLYEQRQMQFATADVDFELQRHLQTNDSYIYHASVALDAKNHGLAELAHAHADDRAALLSSVDGVAPIGLQELILPKDLTPVPPAMPLTFEISPDKGVLYPRVNLVELDIALPPNFPKWIVTSLLGADNRSVRLSVDGASFVATQGKLIRAGTFDIGNVRDGHLVLALPTATSPRSIRLEVDQDPYVKNIWSDRSDALGFDYLAPSKGWMVIRNPYEDGWRATLNGRPAPIFLANQAAMAVPVESGLNKILLEYKPGYSLHRVLETGYLLFSPLLLLLVLFDALARSTRLQASPIQSALRARRE